MYLALTEMPIYCDNNYPACEPLLSLHTIIVRVQKVGISAPESFRRKLTS